MKYSVIIINSGLNSGLNFFSTFQKDKYWLFNRNGKLYAKYPRLIVIGLTDTPSDIDAALLSPHDYKPYFFKSTFR